MGEFHGQTCVVTGGARGIGRAIRDMFIGEGARVHVLDVSDDGDRADSAVFHRCDIADLAAVEAVFAAIGSDSGSVDVVVNNAAVVTPAVPITRLSSEEWCRAMSVNVTGAFHVTRTALPLMGRGGRIINIASTFAHVGSPGRAAYSATKGAILAFSRSLALDLAPDGIRVNSVSPGGIATQRLVEIFGSQDAADGQLGPLHPLGRTGQPDEVAEAVRFLASARSGFMTGADMLVDGGYTAR